MSNVIIPDELESDPVAAHQIPDTQTSRYATSQPKRSTDKNNDQDNQVQTAETDAAAAGTDNGSADQVSAENRTQDEIASDAGPSANDASVASDADPNVDDVEFASDAETPPSKPVTQTQSTLTGKRPKYQVLSRTIERKPSGTGRTIAPSRYSMRARKNAD